MIIKSFIQIVNKRKRRRHERKMLHTLLDYINNRFYLLRKAFCFFIKNTLEIKL